jgi:hypothetical protein
MATTKFLGSYVDRGQRSQLEAEAARLLTDKFNKQLPSSLEVMTSQPLTSQPLEDQEEEEEDERMEIVTVEESSSLTFYMRSSRDSPEPAVQGKNYTERGKLSLVPRSDRIRIRMGLHLCGGKVFCFLLFEDTFTSLFKYKKS